MINPKLTSAACLLSLFFVFSGLPVQAQFFGAGASASGMGGAASTRTDLWAACNNVGALGFLERAAAGLYYENRFILPETGSYGLHLAYPQKAGCFALSISRQGYRLFSRNALGLRYAKNFGPHLSAGLGINYHYVFIGNGYGHASAVSAELGVLGRVNKELSLAFVLINPVRMKLGRYQNQKLPMILRFGISYRWAQKVVTILEVDVDPEQKPDVKFGLEYRPLALFHIRGGFNSRPLGTSFGFGFDYRLLRIDLSASYHPQLGFVPQAAFSASFGKTVSYPFKDIAKKTKHKAS